LDREEPKATCLIIATWS